MIAGAHPARSAALVAAALALGTAAVWAGGTHDLWWTAALVGLAAGLLLPGAESWLVGAGAGLLGWALPLAWLARTADVGEGAGVISALMGFGPPAIPIVFTVAVGLLLSACGAWVGRSLRWLLAPPSERAAMSSDYGSTFDEGRYGPILARQANSPALRHCFAKGQGEEYPDEVDPLGFVTLSELATFVRELDVGPGETLLDLGCGRGGPGLWVAAQTGCDLIGLDIVAEAVEEAALRAPDFVGDGRARFLVGSFMATGLDTASCDAAMSVDALWMVLDKPAALAETARILKRGGRFTFTTWQPPYLDYEDLLNQAGFRLLTRSEPERWLERQLAVYRTVLDQRESLEVELGAGAAVLLAEAAGAPQLLASAPRVLIVAVRE